MNKINQVKSGFILPTVLALSLTVIGVMVVLLGVASANYTGGFIDSYQKLADEAAEAGSAYATACLTLSSHSQTWGPAAGKNNIGPNTDCSGVNTYSSNTYVYSNSKVRSYFSVGNLDYSQQFSAQISAIGYAEVLRPDGSVAKTYSSVQKKSISWPTDIQAQMSDSGTYRTCAIVNYKVYCWGQNGYGQLGDGRYDGTLGTEVASPIDSDVPVKVIQQAGVMAGKKIVKIFAAQYHSCALSDDGLMYCWGENSRGQLGRGTTTNSSANGFPAQVGGALAGKVVTDIGGTQNVTCAIADAKFYCWGNNAYGLTGRGLASGNTSTPTLVTASNTSTTLPTNYSATMLATSGSRSLVMCGVANGKAYCWGRGYHGGIGDGTSVTATGSASTKSVPTKVVDTGVLSGKTVTAIAQDGYLGDVPTTPVDGSHVCVIASGALYCWGENNSGQLGNGTQTDSGVPIAVTASGALSGKTIQDVKAGVYHTCAMASGGFYCWGRNNYGQVADGTNTAKFVPTAALQQPGNLTSSNVVSIGAGANRSCAVISDGRTFCAGLNNSGQIGDGTKIDRNVPTESLFLRPTGNQYIF